MNHAKRDAGTDLTGRRALPLLTGGRAKIGMYIALRLFRDGAHTTITTRFPRDAVRRFAAMPDSASGSIACALSASTCAIRPKCIALADDVAAQGPLDILINNAAADRAPPPPARTPRSSTPRPRRCPTSRYPRS